MRLKIPGYVLLATLIFLQLFTLMSLFALSSVVNLLRLTQQQFQQDTHFASAEQVLKKLEMNLPLTCLVPLRAATDLGGHDQAWWASAGCVGGDKNLRYFYMVEKLFIGEDKIIKNNFNNQCYKPNIYRITLAVFPPSPRYAKQVIQSTVITSSNQIVHCDAAAETVYTGRQMWRQLN
jgi:Tfp pilus assembly protein PilX